MLTLLWPVSRHPGCKTPGGRGRPTRGAPGTEVRPGGRGQEGRVACRALSYLLGSTSGSIGARMLAGRLAGGQPRALGRRGRWGHTLPALRLAVISRSMCSRGVTCKFSRGAREDWRESLLRKQPAQHVKLPPKRPEPHPNAAADEQERLVPAPLHHRGCLGRCNGAHIIAIGHMWGAAHTGILVQYWLLAGSWSAPARAVRMMDPSELPRSGVACSP